MARMRKPDLPSVLRYEDYRSRGLRNFLTPSRRALPLMGAPNQALTVKEIQRGNHLEALAFYNAFTLRPLVEVLRIQYAPQRYNFHTRYVYYELPAEVVQDLEALYFIGDPQEISHKRQQAEAWFYQTLDNLKETL